jgi:hypothetical protein
MRFAAVILTVGAHLAHLIYLPSGGFLALRWPRSYVDGVCYPADRTGAAQALAFSAAAISWVMFAWTRRRRVQPR